MEGNQVVPSPRIAAGSTVVSDWLRLFPWTKGTQYHEDFNKVIPIS
jgi:hypothetical protein